MKDHIRELIGAVEEVRATTDAGIVRLYYDRSGGDDTDLAAAINAANARLDKAILAARSVVEALEKVK